MFAAISQSRLNTTIKIDSLNRSKLKSVNNQEYLRFLSPNTSAFVQYSNQPVNYNTGIPQISIPLFEVSDKNVKLDISLSYHAGGIKVDQEASCVGLGWVLNAGGVIAREVRGIPDGFDYTGSLYKRTSIRDKHFAESITDYGNAIQDDLDQAVQGTTDNSSDIYSYNFMGRVGKFYFNSQGEACFFKHENFKVDFVNTKSYPYLIITDETGVKYIFNEFEFTMKNNDTYVSAWYLTRITSPLGANIKFEYKSGGSSANLYHHRLYQDCFVPMAYSAMKSSIDSKYYIPLFDRNPTRALILDKITLSSGSSILFERGEQRKDAEPYCAYELDAIKLHNIDGREIKRYKLYYSYFEANDLCKVKHDKMSMTHLSHLNYRLRLDSLQDVSIVGNKSIPSYKFRYYGDDNPSTYDDYTLPYRMSPCQDHWGYYNKSLNETIFPGNPKGNHIPLDEMYGRIVDAEYFPMSLEIINGADRNPHAEAVKAGTLNKIIYPTGGYTEYDFENHGVYEGTGYPPFGGLRIRKITTFDNITKENNVRLFEYEPSTSWVSNDCSNGPFGYHTRFWHGWHPQVDKYGLQELLAGFGIPYEESQSEFIIKINSYPLSTLGSESDVNYSSVKETVIGNGYTVYKFSDSPDIWGGYDHTSLPSDPLFNSTHIHFTYQLDWCQGYVHDCDFIRSCTFPYPNFISTSWARGLLLKKEEYSEQGNLIQEIDYEYDTSVLSKDKGYKIIKIDVDKQYIFSEEFIYGGVSKLLKKIEKVYSTNGVVENINEYRYDSPLHMQITDEINYCGDNKYITKYYYPHDYGNKFDSLIDNNMFLPIDTRVYKNQLLISGEQVKYNGIGLPLIAYRANTNSDNKFSIDNPFTFEPYFWRSYNMSNQICSEVSTDQINYTYLWSYKNQYPIVKLTNINYNDVLRILGEVFIEGLANSIEPTKEQINKIKSLQDIYPEALMNFYEYIPGFGLSKETDSRGISLCYEYDEYGNLTSKYMFIDGSKHIIKSYKINYKQ